MVKLRLGDGIAVIALVILLAGVAAPVRAQEAGPSQGDLPDVPIRTLVDVPVPSEPGLPSDPGPPAVIAEHWFAATDDEQRRDIVLDVLAGIGLGVYGMDGTPILFGAEQSVDDPWLYDFEVALLAADPATAPETTVADIAASVEGAVSTTSGESLSASQLADAVRVALGEALADPSDPVGFPLRLARELELQASGRDLAEAVPTEEPLSSLAASLIALDLILGLAGPDGSAVAVAPGTHVPLAASIPAISLADQPSRRESVRTAQACQGIASSGATTTWVAAIARVLRQSGVVVGPVLSPLSDLLHAELLRSSLKVVYGHGDGPKKFHYRHRSQERAEAFAIGLWMDVQLPREVAACGPLVGAELPKPGLLKDVPLTWDASRLDKHGEATCGARCPTTGSSGYGELEFLAKLEPAPVALGPVQEFHTDLSVRFDIGAVFPLSVFPQLTAKARATMPVWIGRHQPYEFELVIDSKIQGTGFARFATTAKGRIHISPDSPDAVALTGVGEVKVKTSPRPANCKQASAKGQGTVDMFVDDVEISEGSQDVVVWINLDPKQKSPDLLTFPKCGQAPKRVIGYSAWEQHFGQAHRKSRSGALWGIELSGWEWWADEKTLEDGGLLATLETPERCPLRQVGCKGMTQFQLYIYPVEE